MKIGLFVDVDRTITRNFIQQDVARALGCENEYRNLEEGFQNQTISSDEFGEQLIAIFASKQFTRQKARDTYESVQLQPWAAELLQLKIDKYLVSSGPSYFIDELARNYNIPQDHVCRSEYIFDNRTGIIQSCNAISAQQKAQFVKHNLSKYAITIGIGDHPEHDGPFVSLCTIPLLTINTDKYISVKTFSLVIVLIQNMMKLGRDELAPLDVRKLTPLQVLRSFTLGSWLTLGPALVAVASAGFAVGKWWK